MSEADPFSRFPTDHSQVPKPREAAPDAEQHAAIRLTPEQARRLWEAIETWQPPPSANEAGRG